jgi:uncharacterized repeat protein (TIGR01451 family)
MNKFNGDALHVSGTSILVVKKFTTPILTFITAWCNILGRIMMKIHPLLLILLLTALIGISGAANITSLTDSQGAASQVQVTKVTVSPEILMYGDTGTVTIAITNTGTIPVGIDTVYFSDPKLSITNYQAYQTGSTIGAGVTREYYYIVSADAPDGIYTPRFYVAFSENAGSLRYFVPLRVDNRPLEAAVINVPEVFTLGNKETVTISLGNPRDNTLSGVTVILQGDSLYANQSTYFVGDLAPGQTINKDFEITPYQETVLTISVSYLNGINEHSTQVTVPIQIGQNKKSPHPIINNIVITTVGDAFQLTGDVTNGGLQTANAITVGVGSPAEALDPYQIYVVGSLQPDDFSSFELTFRAPGETTVPVVITYKDADGNSYRDTIPVSLLASNQVDTSGSGSGSSTRSGGLFGGSSNSTAPEIPWVWIIIGIVIVAAGVYTWKKGFLHRSRKKK